MKVPKILRRIFFAAMAVIFLMNLTAAFHAYKFTHFSTTAQNKTPDAQKLSLLQKSGALVFGVSNPRPVNSAVPASSFATIKIMDGNIEGWLINVDSAKGTVIMFHGFSAEKSSLLNKAEVFNNLGYNTFLIDFRGSGGSNGNNTTIGYKEAEEVKAAAGYIEKTGETNIILFGSSMGAAAILRAVSEYKIHPASIIIECPFGSAVETVEARFRLMGVPSFPMAYLLVFWGGTLNGFNAFGHKPAEYAKNVNCPALLLYGERDDRVTRKETDRIFKNLPSKKTSQTFPNAGHDDYLITNPTEWAECIKEFLAK